MAKIKFEPNLFLGKQELNRLQEFMDDNSVAGAASWGIVDNPKDADYLNFKVTPSVTPGNIQIHLTSEAIDGQGRTITYSQSYAEEFPIPLANEYYWVKIGYKASPIEQGTVSIDASGNLTGVGTQFTQTLRGLPNFPSRIKFYDNSLNLTEYVVVEVVDDTNAILQGVFAVESNVKYSVWGTFTPGHIATTDAEPFQYDSVELTFIRESTAVIDPGTGRPVKIDDLEFYIARVQTIAGVVEVQDKRNLELWRSNAEFRSWFVPATTNPLIGIESIKYDNTRTTRVESQVTLSWGFRSSNWTINPTTNLITLNSGLGGKFKSTSDFTDGDFDGWRIYNDLGEYFIIQSSSKSGSNINLTVRGLDLAKFTALSEVLVTPDVEAVEVGFFPTINTTVDEQLKKIIEWPVNSPTAKASLTVPVLTGTYSYYVQYRYRNNHTYSKWYDFPEDVSVGYYDESSFEVNGELKANPIDRNQKTYTIAVNVGWLELIPHSNSYANVLQRIDLGDILGVEYQTTNNASPVISLLVGTQRQVQIIQFGTEFTTDHFINLRSTDAVNGNKFFLIFEGAYARDTFNLFINEDFINPGTPGDQRFQFQRIDDNRAKNENLMLRCDFDGTDWHVQLITSGDVTQWYIVGDADPKISLGTIYAGAASGDLRFRLDESGNVQLQGRIDLGVDLTPDTGAPTTFRDIFTLPVGFRPTFGSGGAQHITMVYDSDTNTGAVNPNFVGGGVRVTTAGLFTVPQARHFVRRVYVNAQFPTK